MSLDRLRERRQAPIQYAQVSEAFFHMALRIIFFPSTENFDSSGMFIGVIR